MHAKKIIMLGGLEKLVSNDSSLEIPLDVAKCCILFSRSRMICISLLGICYIGSVFTVRIIYNIYLVYILFVDFCGFVLVLDNDVRVCRHSSACLYFSDQTAHVKGL